MGTNRTSPQRPNVNVLIILAAPGPHSRSVWLLYCALRLLALSRSLAVLSSPCLAEGE